MRKKKDIFAMLKATSNKDKNTLISGHFNTQALSPSGPNEQSSGQKWVRKNRD